MVSVNQVIGRVQFRHARRGQAWTRQFQLSLEAEHGASTGTELAVADELLDETGLVDVRNAPATTRKKSGRGAAKSGQRLPAPRRSRT